MPRFGWLGVISLFNGLSTLWGLFNAKLVVHKGLHTFPAVISPKANNIARIKFEFTYYVAVENFFFCLMTFQPFWVI